MLRDKKREQAKHNYNVLIGTSDTDSYQTKKESSNYMSLHRYLNDDWVPSKAIENESTGFNLK